MSIQSATFEVEQITKLATFHIGHLFFGVDVTRVQEVLRHHPITAVPLAPATVEGLINLRGQLVVAIDVRARLGLPEKVEKETQMNVVVYTAEGAVSLLVDQIGDVIEVNHGTYERAPENLSTDVRALVLGVHKLDSGILLILDVEQAASVASGAIN